MPGSPARYRKVNTRPSASVRFHGSRAFSWDSSLGLPGSGRKLKRIAQVGPMVVDCAAGGSAASAAYALTRPTPLHYLLWVKSRP